jgi:tRNA (Thr-GGU) A37 N-methylase
MRGSEYGPAGTGSGSALPARSNSARVTSADAPVLTGPIGLTVVELLERDGHRIRVRGVDMLDGTPIIDIKPYLSSVPVEALRRGWLAEAEVRSTQGGTPAG